MLVERGGAARLQAWNAAEETHTLGRIALTIAAAWVTVQAAAETLVATRPGLMCRSPGPLATLTLHDGSSRALSPKVRNTDGALKDAGGCLDFSPGQRVTLLRARHQTSMVTADPGDGAGARTFIVPNIDFALEPPPGSPSPARSAAGRAAPKAASATPQRTASPAASQENQPSNPAAEKLFAAIHDACPRQGWTATLLSQQEPGPIDQVFYAMKRGEQLVAQDEADAECGKPGRIACVKATIFGVMVRAGHLPEMVHAACTHGAPGR